MNVQFLHDEDGGGDNNNDKSLQKDPPFHDNSNL